MNTMRHAFPPIRKRQRWHPSKVAVVERLVNSGKSYSEIACAIGVSKGSIASLVANRIHPKPSAANETLRWRLRQLITAGFTPEEAADLINADVLIARDVFDEIYEEVCD